MKKYKLKQGYRSGQALSVLTAIDKLLALTANIRAALSHARVVRSSCLF